MSNDSEKCHQEEDADWELIVFDPREQESAEGMILENSTPSHEFDFDKDLLSLESDAETDAEHPESDAETDAEYPESDAETNAEYPESDAETDAEYPESDADINKVFPGSHILNRFKMISLSSGSSSSFTRYTNFSEYVKLKKDTAIKDVVKELALPYLPAKSLCRFRTVSKEWHQWLTSPFLAHKQSTQFKRISGLFCQFPGEDPSFISLDKNAYGVPCPSLNFLPEPVDIRTSCNGLLCCQGQYGDMCYYICNPSNQEWRMLPESILYHGHGTSIALVFQPEVLNFAACFELICLVPSLDAPVLQFEIYSSRTSTWRVCEKLCCEPESIAVTGDGCYFNGFVYWETESNGILAFDVKNEEYGFIKFPPRSGPTGTLAEDHGELCYLMPCEENGVFTIEVYGGLTMTLKYMIELDSWRFGEVEELRALSRANDDIIIISVGKKVMSYNLRSHEFEVLSNLWNYYGFPKYLPYVNNLVPVSHHSIRNVR